MSFDRHTNVRRLGDEEFDVVVIGGGITGAGCALDAASRGLRTALVERDDFASGTSSKSSKMVHGGLRYLQQREIRLVYEALRERRRLLRNAPHLVRVVPHLIPMFGKGGVVPKSLSRAFGSALWLYDLTGGFRIGKMHKRISRDEALAHAPTLDPERLVSGYLYYDCLADDARLTLALARTAALDHGAAVANRTEVIGIGHGSDGRVTSVRVRTDGRELDIRTRGVISATGVWVDDIAMFDEGHDPDATRPAKGIHLTIPHHLVGNDIAISGLAVPADKRSMFVVPWGELAYLGTTDTDYDGPLDDPQCTPEDVDYLLGGFNHWFTRKATRADVVGTWAGLRPLVRNASSDRTADLSRRHSVTTSPSGVVTVTGGKLTTYREMAADAVDAAVATFPDRPRRLRRSRTARLRLRGAATGDHQDHLYARYGAEAAAVRQLIADEPDLAHPLVPGLPYLRAEAVRAVREEMATTVDDVLSRRTRSRLMARDASAQAAAAVAALIGPELGWTPGDEQAEVDAYRASIEHERAAADLPITEVVP
ncbi:MAG: glycerol-3-phosphate dehydrogenase/oxidase [Acidimicrobiia bacterium]|nr:glycerol-3-phosphate dehydrogenase/oxidase [Acidimicrobiia bacterium]